MKNSNSRYTIKNLAVVLGAFSLLSVAGCYSGGNNPGIEYAPNMYISEAYEAYTQTEDMKYNPMGMTMRTPVEGVIARGQMDYLGYPEGYEASSVWTNPIRPTEEVVVEGGRLYNINCQHCHGKSGKNDGGVIKSGQYPPPPFDNLQSDYIKTLADGKIYHTITHGKGNMGSHAAMLTPKERWMVLHYVRKLSLGEDFVYASADAESTPSLGESKSRPAWLTGYEFADISDQDYSAIASAMEHVKFGNIRFKIMKDESKPFLDQVATYLVNHADVKAVVVGHISSDAEMDAIQENLSEIRANAVIDYLVEKGVNADKCVSKGMGANQPISSNDTKEGRDMNRRVEIYFVK